MMATCLTGMSRIPQAIDALKKAITCTNYHTGNYPRDALDTKWSRIELLYQLANIYEESQNRLEAIRYLEICIDEFDVVENSGDRDRANRSAVVSILYRARLLLARWAAADSDYSKARYLASQIDQDSEFAIEAQDILHTFDLEEDAGSSE
jgi:tetratricopeptide (TPR) repeat protein